jgi:hypothetical protein
MRQATGFFRSGNKKNTFNSNQVEMSASKADLMTTGVGGEVNRSSSGTFSRAELENTVADLPMTEYVGPRSKQSHGNLI